MTCSERMKLRWQNPEYRKRMSEAHKGQIPTNLKELIAYSKSPEGRAHNGKAHLGQVPWNKGKKQLNITAEKHYLWKGEKVSYGALHRWVRKQLGTAKKCCECGIQKTCKDGRSYVQWANISGKYKRTLDDWKQLCYLCHKAFDGYGDRKVNQ